MARPARTIVSRPGPRPPYHALSITAPKSSRKGTSCGITGASRSSIPNATPTSRTATPYRKIGEARFGESIWILNLSNAAGRHRPASASRWPLWHLHVFTLPFCSLARFRAYPKCSIFQSRLFLGRSAGSATAVCSPGPETSSGSRPVVCSSAKSALSDQVSAASFFLAEGAPCIRLMRLCMALPYSAVAPPTGLATIPGPLSAPSPRVTSI